MAPSKRFLFLTTSYPRDDDSAAGHFVRSEVNLLRSQGHKVIVAAPGNSFVDPGVIDLGARALFAAPGAIPRLQQNPLRILGLVPATIRAALELRGEAPFDQIICHWLLPSAFPWGLLVAHRAKKLQAVAHGSDVRLALGLPAPFRNYIFRALVRAGFELRIVSEELKVALLASNWSPPVRRFIEQAHVEASPIDCRGTPDRTGARTSLGLDAEDQWAVWVGRLIAGKRPDVALAAAALIPKLKVAIIGEGPMREALERAYPTVKFLGKLPREETLRWISAADLLMSTSRLEGAPTAIREARTLGTPVISSPCGDVDQWAQADPGLWVVHSSQASARRGKS